MTHYQFLQTTTLQFLTNLLSALPLLSYFTPFPHKDRQAVYGNGIYYSSTLIAVAIRSTHKHDYSYQNVKRGRKRIVQIMGCAEKYDTNIITTIIATATTCVEA
jgi:hypothetical protein